MPCKFRPARRARGKGPRSRRLCRLGIYTDTLGVHAWSVRAKTVEKIVCLNVAIEFGIPMKLVRLTKMCLTEMCSRNRIGKNLSDMFPVRNGLKQGDALPLLLLNFTLVYAIRKV
jgi:hypothetical protein